MKKFLLIVGLVFTFCSFIGKESFAIDYFELGKKAFYAKDYNAAEYNFRKEMLNNPQNYECLYFLGHTYYYQEKFDYAQREYKKVMTNAQSLVLKKHAQISYNQITKQKAMAHKRVVKEEIKDNYLKAINKQESKCIKWQYNTITVYIEPGEYKQMIKAAFMQWQKETSGFVKFTFISEENPANISVYMVDKISRQNDEESAIGVAIPRFYPQTGYFSKVNIEILKADLHTGEKTPLDNVYSTALHEIGHAIGILGHSDSKNDLMYPYSKSRLNFRTISSRDKKTLRMIYQQCNN